MNGMTEKFDNKAIYLDTAPLIYYFEEHPIYFSKLKELFQKNERGDFNFYTSTITISEVLILPYKLGQISLIDRYEYFLNQSEFLNVVNVNPSIAKLSAKLRSDFGFKLPDAIHLATSIEVKADLFLTNDLSLSKVSGLKIINPADV